MFESVLGQKIQGTRVVPLVVKIVTIFTIFLLVSNFVTNYINLLLNRGEQIRLLNELLVKDLKELHVFANNQYEIYSFNPDLAGTISNIESAAVRNHRGRRSLTIGVRRDGELFFQGSELEAAQMLDDTVAVQRMVSSLQQGREEGTLNFRFAGFDYFGVYKYNERWDMFSLRAEELTEFYADSVRIFRNVAIIIVGITAIFSIVGIVLLRFILRFVGSLTKNIMKMQEHQQLTVMDLSGAPNDDVTYLGVAFNSLSNTIDNLMNIFKKFVARDVAARAYREREIRLEGARKELTILFTDIKSFTFMTETLGTDIIKLLNLHYDRAIRHIHAKNGDIGSIIGDALLAIYGVMNENGENKSMQAIESAYLIHEVASSLRREMRERYEDIVRQRGALTEAEDAVYRAVLLEVGVGIDGGTVFYGNIGSYERMVNTVIGDNVNSASRLEGLTRVYKVPVIVSDYVRQETGDRNGYRFLELDQVQVKGKTVGKRIYWPVPVARMDSAFERDLAAYEQALAAYYAGDWPQAERAFAASTLPAAQMFSDRITGRRCPTDWNGVWTMNEK